MIVQTLQKLATEEWIWLFLYLQSLLKNLNFIFFLAHLFLFNLSQVIPLDEDENVGGGSDGRDARRNVKEHARAIVEGVVVELPESRIDKHWCDSWHERQEGEELSHLVGVNRLGQERADDAELAVAKHSEQVGKVILPQRRRQRLQDWGDNLAGDKDCRQHGVVNFQLAAEDGHQDDEEEWSSGRTIAIVKLFWL